MKSIVYALENVDAYNCARTESGWKVIFPEIIGMPDDDDEDMKFKQLYADALMESEAEILKHAEKMSKSEIPYTIGQWHKAVNASFSKATKKLHDFVMGNNCCDDLIFHLEVIDNRTIEVH